VKVGTKLGILAFVVAAATVALWFRKIGQVDIPVDRTAYVIAFLFAAALGAGAFVTGVRWLGGVAAGLAIVIGLFFPFTVAISRQEVAANVISVGDNIPRFTAVDEHGQLFDSESLRGHLVLIKFFRAHW
jgi:cytochrome oxidase Cu insertion factor (SCO1/SenC/PrrC family)